MEAEHIMNKELLKKLLEVQKNLKAPKNQKNTFSNFMYRSCEDILQAARPLCNENGLLLLLKDSIEQVGERYYVKSTAQVVDIDSGESIETEAFAREPEQKTKFDDAQVTGASSSYARKYALCALFAIDDTRDADTDEYQRQAKGNQQAAQSSKPKQANTSPQDEKKAVLQRLTADMKQNGMGNEEMKLLIQKKFGKESSAALSLQECKILAANYQKLWQQLMDDLGKGDAA